MKQVKNYINGEWADSDTKEYGDVWCPASGEKIGEVPFSTAEDIDKAVQADCPRAAVAYRHPFRKRRKTIVDFVMDDDLNS